MAESTSSKNALCVADPSGDVILVVGGSIVPDDTLSIQVSSHVLGLVSPVFKAMFSSRYQEGAMLKPTADQPVSISLPEDSPEAVSLACRMFHYNLDDTLEHPGLDLLEKLATFCDKYNCARAVRPSTRLWVRPYDCYGGVPGFYSLLVVSYMLDDPTFFSKVTRELVCRYTGSYMDFVLQHGRNILPSCVCCEYSRSETNENRLTLIILVALEEKRKKLNNRIEVAVQLLIEPLISGHQTSVAAYFKELYRCGVYPWKLTASVDSTIASLKRFDACILNTVNCPCGICHKVGNLSEKVREIGVQARSWTEDICLDCMHQGGRNTGKCRIEHD